MPQQYTILEPCEKQLVKALAFAFTQRGAAMRELFAGERADLIEELRIVAPRYGRTTDLGKLIALALRMDSLPIMRAAMQVIEGSGAPPTNLSPPESRPLSSSRRKVLDALADEPMTVALLAARLGMRRTALGNLLTRMVRDGQVERHGTVYHLVTGDE